MENADEDLIKGKTQKHFYKAWHSLQQTATLTTHAFALKPQVWLDEQVRKIHMGDVSPLQLITKASTI